MKRILTKMICASGAAALAVVMLAQSLSAGGFSIYEQGANATAMGSAMVARPWDANAVFYNPAGLAIFGTPGQWRFYGGVVPIKSIGRFTGMNPSPGEVREKNVSKFFFPFNLYAVYQINEKMAAGLGVTTPYGLGTKWPDNFSGRFRANESRIQSLYITPSFSYKMNDNFSFAAGVDYVYSRVLLRRNNPQTFFNGTETKVYDVAEVKLEGSDKASFTFNLGAFYRMNEQLSFGMTYKHQVKNDYKGKAKFTQILHTDQYATDPFSQVVDNTVAARLNDPAFGGLKQDGNTKITFPSILTLGVAYKPIDKLSLEVDYLWFKWSVFKEIRLEFPSNTSLNNAIAEDYRDAYQVRFGAEYWAMENLALRGGFMYDHTPTPTHTLSSMLPDADRYNISAGLGYKFTKGLRCDLSYMAVNISERSTKGKNVDKFDGTYKVFVNLFSFGIAYALDGK